MPRKSPARSPGTLPAWKAPARHPVLPWRSKDRPESEHGLPGRTKDAPDHVDRAALTRARHGRRVGGTRSTHDIYRELFEFHEKEQRHVHDRTRDPCPRLLFEAAGFAARAS